MSICILHRRSLSPVLLGASSDHWTSKSSWKTCDNRHWCRRRCPTSTSCFRARKRHCDHWSTFTLHCGWLTAGEVLGQHGGIRWWMPQGEGEDTKAGACLPALSDVWGMVTLATTVQPTSKTSAAQSIRVLVVWSTVISSCIGDSQSLWTKNNVLLKPPTPAVIEEVRTILAPQERVRLWRTVTPLWGAKNLG